MSQVPMSADTVQVQIQVIDVNSFSLSLILPTFRPASDLTVRIAKDAGLDSTWPSKYLAPVGPKLALKAALQLQLGVPWIDFLVSL